MTGLPWRRGGGRGAPPGAGGAAPSLAALLLAVACAPGPAPPEAPEPPPPEAPPLPESEPTVRVGLFVGEGPVEVAGTTGLTAVDGAGEPLEGAAAGALRLRAGPDGVVADPPGHDSAAVPRRPGRGPAEPPSQVRLRDAAGGALTVDGRPYRGSLDVYRLPGRGLVVVNELELETYLLGVVPVEIGPRAAGEFEAVKAQAVAARTYAVRNMGRRDSLGFDVFGSVEDQVYGGREAEREQASRAVRETRGEVVTHRGRPIRAYYHSTGGGLTARVTDVWDLPDAPYLRRISDRRPGGGDYCDISPRYRWEETWGQEQLLEAVRAGVREHFPQSGTRVGAVRGVTVLSRTPGGRVAELEVRTDAGRFVLDRNRIRFFLRTPDGRVLRSTHFRVEASPPGAEVLTLRGRGYGHGVGMCQWGAIGRARAGQGYREILEHYYPGTELTRAY